MKGIPMKARIIFGTIFVMFVFTLPAIAGGKSELQKHFSDVANKVKATENAIEKREILNESFLNMTEALDKVQNSGLISENDRIGIDRFKAALQEKQDELAGINGYERVPDAQLNAFSNYVVQDMEQAAEMITISVLALVLIIVLVILLL